MDDFRNPERIRETDIRMSNKKADFVCIQETHNIKDNEMELGNYKIFFSKAENDNIANKGSGGGSCDNGKESCKPHYKYK